MKLALATLVALACATPVATQQNVCVTELAGSGCGPVLDITFTPVGNAGNNTIAINGSGLHANGVGVMVWGTMPLNAPVFANCFAYTDFIWGHPINIDASGAWSWSRSWPGSIQGSYRIQLASVGLDGTGNPTIMTSDCIVASCSL